MTKGDTDRSLAATVGGRLRALRRARAEKQMAVGRAVGISHGTLSLYESGNRQPPLAVLTALARHYRVPLAAIITEED